jgi:prepilin-type N-terminal cleavage/methylation domain-containing protein
MRCRDAARPRGARGFTLIEIVVAIALISLVAGALAPLGVRSLRASQQEKTRQRMDAVMRAMIGEPALGDYGYLGDLGQLPPALVDLNSGAGKPAFAFNATDAVGYGWSGPYAPTLAAPGAPLVDAYGQPFAYDGITAQLRSSGPDRALGTADDLVRPFAPAATVGSLSVSVLGIPSGGGPAQQLGAAQVSVFVASSVGGVRSEQLAAGVGPFTASGLHLGMHAVRAQGAGAWSGAPAVRDVVAIHRGVAYRTFVLVQP